MTNDRADLETRRVLATSQDSQARAAAEAVETARLASGLRGDLAVLVHERAVFLVEALEDSRARSALLSRLGSSSSCSRSVASRREAHEGWFAAVVRLTRSERAEVAAPDARPGEVIAGRWKLRRQESGRSLLVRRAGAVLEVAPLAEAG